MSRPNGIEAIVDDLRAEQSRVAALVGEIPAEAWTRPLREADRWDLVSRGHFPEYAPELAWPVRDVVGHLRDSARVFRRRVELIRGADRPVLEDFDPIAPALVEEYRRTPRPRLVAELLADQHDLLEAVRAVTPDDLRREAVHEVDGPVTLEALLRFVVAHQSDHRAQLEAIGVVARDDGPG